MIFIYGPKTDRSDAIERALAARKLLCLRSEDREYMARQLATNNTDIVLCVQARKIFPKPPRRRVFVLHDSMLPQFRGCAPLAWQIIRGSHNFGVTLIEAVDAVDAGPIIAYNRLPFDRVPTYDEIYDLLTPKYVELTLGHIDSLIAGTYKSYQQSAFGTEPSYGSRRTPEDSILFPEIHSSMEAERIFRASSARFGFPCSLSVDIADNSVDDLSCRYITGVVKHGVKLFGRPGARRRLTKDSAVVVFADGYSLQLTFGPNRRKLEGTEVQG